MKIKEHDSMVAYLTRPGKVLANNINNKKNSHRERPGFAKGTKSDTTPTPKNNKMLQYINDHRIVFDGKEATDAEKDAAAKRIDTYKNQMSYQDQYNTYFNKASPKYYKRIVDRPKPIKPDLPNGHSDWSPEELMEAIDPSWWLPEDDKKVEANSLYERYLDLLKSGELLPGVTFQMFEANPIGYDPEAIAKMNKEINKRIAAKKSKEGLAALLAT